MGGYVARSYIVPPDELNPATWDLDEITLRVAEFRERLGVPELDRSEFGTHVCPVPDGWRVVPPIADMSWPASGSGVADGAGDGTGMVWPACGSAAAGAGAGMMWPRCMCMWGRLVGA